MTTIRHTWTATRRWLRALSDDERGDVPGWVLVTLVTMS